jgi:hypothetical protein
MSSFDRSGSRGAGRGTDDVSPVNPGDAEPPGHSMRVRRVVRSSRPPAGFDRDARDLSGARALPVSQRVVIGSDEESSQMRAKRATPAERPRRRRQVQVAQADARSRKSTPPARPSSLRTQDESEGEGSAEAAARATSAHVAEASARRTRAFRVACAVAIALVAAIVWLLFVR